MIASIKYTLICLTPVLFNSKTYAADPQPPPPYLALYSPGEPDYTDVLVKRALDDLTLVCELRAKGELAPPVYVWNYVGDNATLDRPFTVSPSGHGPSANSTLTRLSLQLSDSGHYMCSAPPFSVTKYILVQPKGPRQCARGAFWCGARCVLAAYVCDGFTDCAGNEDEAAALCAPRPCARADKLNCSSGRCISEAACCRAAEPLCRQPACCDEHPRYSRQEGYVDIEYPPLFEDRHAPDDYGFIQSTIYTVTACALIFMIAVVLLVSAICKMHMKRAALRSYAHAERATRQHYSVQYAQTHRFPPCYETSRLLEAAAPAPPSPPRAPPPAPPPPPPPLQCTTECPTEESPEAAADEDRTGFGLARLSAIFSSRYRQVPTQCLDVEMTDVRPSSLTSSPRRTLDHYRSPTFCDLNTELFFNPETSHCGRDLNYMATPVEFFRRRALGNMEERPRNLTLQLGRFQLSIPRFGRRASLDRRPDTPNVAELNIEDVDFVRLNSNDTYTLNGRTIRLLGANFENYPGLNDTVRPPPYTEAMRYKLYGPPPEYLSRDGLNNERDNETVTVNEQQARNNVEMPPCYDDLASGVDANANNSIDSINSTTVATVTVDNNVSDSLRSVIDNLPAIDSDVNANEADTRFSNVINNVDNEASTNNNVC